MSTVPPPPSPPPAPDRPPQRGRRLLAGAAVATLLAGSSLATGAVLGLHLQHADTSTSGTVEQSPSVVADPPSYAGPPSYDGQAGPFAADDHASASSSSDATAEESSGLVLISSTLSQGRAAGTGILLSGDGTVVTNHHVVEGATDLEVTVATTGETFSARYVGGSAATDVAVIELEDASGLTPAELSEDDAALGDAVTAVGDAGGDGGSLTASPGTVTALDQDVTVSNSDGTSTTLEDLIQLQAVVVPGDSGGAVLDGDGEVVGMNVAASSDSRSAVGYAIPFDIVQDVVDQVLAGEESGDVELGYHGYLGITLDAETDAPVVLDVAAGTAAADAGLATGDRLTGVGSVDVSTADGLRELIASYDAGDRVRIAWTTAAGEGRSATVTLGEAPVG